MNWLERELQKIQLQIARLEGRRDLLLEMSEGGEKLGPVSVSDGAAGRGPHPRSQSTTDAILQVVQEHPGLTLGNIAQAVLDLTGGGDDRRRRSIYNTAHGLARRNRVRRDDNTGKVYPQNGAASAAQD